MAAKRIVLAHEMGAGWGHLIPFKAVAGKFSDSDCDVFLLTQNVARAQEVFNDTRVQVTSIPTWPIRKSRFSLNYAQCVWGNGWWSGEDFQVHLDWWSKAFMDLRPDFVLTDFAPTALLAAQALNLPRGLWGTGFAVPPSRTPLPSLHPWLGVETRQLLAVEAPVLERVQSAVPGARYVADLFAGARRFLTIFPESDHFGEREDESYRGPVVIGGAGDEVNWPAGKGPRVFAYLNAGNRCRGAFLACLRRLGWPAFACIPGFDRKDCREQGSATLRISPSLVDLESAAAGADLAVTQGGMHTSLFMMLAGVTVMILPEQLEQVVLAYRLHDRGLCEWLSPWTDCGKIAERMQRLRSSGEVAANVSAFAEKYAGYDSGRTISHIVETCLDVKQ